MTSVREEYEERQRKKVVRQLKAFMKRIEKGQVKVVKAGIWEGEHGCWNLSISVRESDNFRPFTELSENVSRL